MVAKPERDRFYDVDGLRFFAALVVVFYHYTFRGYAADDFSPVHFPLMEGIAKYGYLGVDLFFIISGFVILMSAGHGSWPKFIISRFVRIYPTFWLALLLTGGAMYFYDTAPLLLNMKDWFLNAFLVGSFVGVPYLDSVYWSLLVELKFYFLIFLCLIFKSIQHIFKFLLVWLVLCFCLTFLPLKIPYADFFLFPEWAHYFIAGSLFFLIRRDGLTPLKAIMLLGCWGLSLHYGFAFIERAEVKFQSDFSPIFVASSISVFYLLFGLIALKKSNWFNLPWMLKFGALTYPLYLIHQNIGYILLDVLNPHLNRYVILIGLLAIMIGASYVINELAERWLNPFFKRLSEQLLRTLKLYN